MKQIDKQIKQIVYVKYHEQGYDDQTYSRTYTYIYNLKEPIHPGDYVICDTMYGPALGKVVDVIPYTPLKYPSRYVITKVDLHNYERIHEQYAKRELLADLWKKQEEAERLKNAYEELKDYIKELEKDVFGNFEEIEYYDEVE